MPKQCIKDVAAEGVYYVIGAPFVPRLAIFPSHIDLYVFHFVP